MLEMNTVKTLLDFVTKESSINKKHSMIGAWRKIAALKKDEGDETPLENMMRKLTQEKVYVPATKSQMSKKIDMNELIKLRNEYDLKIKDKSSCFDTYHLICCLYTMLAPLRSQDYYDTLIKTDDTDLENDNYYDLENQTITLNKYKTSAIHGTRIIDVSNELHDVIEAYHRKIGGEYIITSSTGHKLNAKTFGKTMSRCFKRNISSSALRNSFISMQIDKGMTMEQRKETAKIMGHSISTQQSVYSKYSDTLHPREDDLSYLLRRRKQLADELHRINEIILNKI
jgi:hypothetical protein